MPRPGLLIHTVFEPNQIIATLHLSQVLHLPRKSAAESHEVLYLTHKITYLKIVCPKMQPLSGNQRPDLRTCLINMSLVLDLPCEIYLYRSSF